MADVFVKFRIKDVERDALLVGQIVLELVVRQRESEIFAGNLKQELFIVQPGNKAGKVGRLKGGEVEIIHGVNY
jgi:hypothetical protein